MLDEALGQPQLLASLEEARLRELLLEPKLQQKMVDFRAESFDEMLFSA